MEYALLLWHSPRHSVPSICRKLTKLKTENTHQTETTDLIKTLTLRRTVCVCLSIFLSVVCTSNTFNSFTNGMKFSVEIRSTKTTHQLKCTKHLNFEAVIESATLKL